MSDHVERRRALGRERSARFYAKHQPALQRKAYLRCLEKGLIKCARPGTALKYGLTPPPPTGGGLVADAVALVNSAAWAEGEGT